MNKLADWLLDNDSISNKDEELKIEDQYNYPSDDMINEDVSAGTIGILKALSIPMNFKRKYNIFLINVYTLARNILSYFNPISSVTENTLKKEPCVNYIKKDIEMILYYIQSYISFTKVTLLNTTSYKVIFYFPFYYKVLPSEYYRNPNKIVRLTNTIYQYIYEPNSIQYNRLYKKNDLMYFVYLNPLQYTSISLFNILKVTKILSKRPLIFTHIPLDYHLIKLLYNVNFVDSHTGKILASKQHIANKIFKTESIPFNKYSHWLFGDKYILKSNLPRGMKTKLILMGSEYKWNIMTDGQFLKQMVKLNLINTSNYKFHPY